MSTRRVALHEGRLLQVVTIDVNENHLGESDAFIDSLALD